MKKAILFLTLLFGVACNDSAKTDKIVHNHIKEYMNKNLKDPSSYEVVKKGNLDSVFIPKTVYIM